MPPPFTTKTMHEIEKERKDKNTKNQSMENFLNRWKIKNKIRHYQRELNNLTK
jgi:hypothetical protein